MHEKNLNIFKMLFGKLNFVWEIRGLGYKDKNKTGL